MAIWPGATPGLASNTTPQTINSFARRKDSSESMETVPTPANPAAVELQPGIDVTPATASAEPPAPSGTKLKVKDWTGAAAQAGSTTKETINLQPNSNPDGVKVYGLLKSDPILSKMLDKCKKSKGLSETMQGVWLRARAERLRKVVVDNVPNGQSKIHSVTIQRELQGGMSYGFEIGSKDDEGHVITAVSADGPAHNVIHRSDHILIVNQQLAIDCNHEEVCKIFADSRKLNMTVLRFGEESSTETPTRRSRSPRRKADKVAANAAGSSPTKPLTVEMTVTRGPDEPLGLTLATIQAAGQATTTVSAVVIGGAADKAGIRSGDVVRSVNGLSTASSSHKAILEQIRTAVGDMKFAVERDPALRPVTVFEADPSLFAMQRTETSLSPVVQRRPKDGTDKTKNMQRRDTIYLNHMAVPKSLPLLARMRGGGAKQATPSSFAVPTLSKDDAKLMLVSSGDGAYLFREARGVIVLSVVHEGEVKHYTLKISLSLPYREVDKALRKFVKHYSNRRANRSGGLPCTLTEYIMDMPFAAVEDSGAMANLGAATCEDAAATAAETVDAVPGTTWGGASSLSTRKVTARRDGSSLEFGQAPIGESTLDENDDCLDEDGLPVRSPANPSPVQEEEQAASRPVTQSQSQTEGLATFAMPPPPAAVPAADAAGPAAKEAADGGTDAGEKKPRRRKLVRGANVTEAKVLPAFQQALDALDDLDSFLNVYEEMHQDYESLEGEKASGNGFVNEKSYFSFKNLVKPSHKGFADLPSMAGVGSDGVTDSTDRSAYVPGGKIAKQPAPSAYAMAMDTLF